MASLEDDNKALLRRWFEEVWNQGREDLIDELRAPDAIGYGLGESEVRAEGAPDFKTFYHNLRDTFPDLQIAIDDMIAEGDKVAIRVTCQGTHIGDGLGVPPTGRRVRFSGIQFVRIANGRIVEAWNRLDQLGLLRQIDALPVSGVDRFLVRR